MRIRNIPRSSAILAIALIAAIAVKLDAAPFGSALRAAAEQLGLQAAQVPDNLPVNTPVTLTVVNPERLSGYGLTGLKANDKVQVTILDGGKLSIVPVKSLVLSVDTKGMITGYSVVSLPTQKLNIPATTTLVPLRR